METKKPSFFTKLFGRKSTDTPSSVEKKKTNTDSVSIFKDAERAYYEGVMTLRDLIAPSSVEVTPQYMKIGSTYSRSFFVYAYPRFLDTNWLSALINSEINFDISQVIYPKPSEEILKLLRKRVGQMRSTIRMRQERGMSRDPAIEIALQDAEELRDDLQKGQEKFFHLGMYITIYAQDKDKLDKMSVELESLLGAKLILTKRANLQMEHGFHSTLPMGLDDLQIVRNMNTSPLSTAFPFSSSDLTSDKGILYGLNRHNQSLIIFDRFSLENANSVVFATSGAGKSYAVKLEILRLIMMGVDVMVIDPEKEYKALSDLVGGTYLTLSLNANEKINPFDLPQGIKDDITKPGDLLRSAIMNLHGLLRLMLGDLTPEQEALLDKALLDTYAIKGITLEIENPGELEPPTLQDLYTVLQNHPEGGALAIRLEKYISGSYAGMFNQHTNVDLQSGMLVFNVRDLEDDLRPIAMYILLNFIWSRVRSSLKKRVLVIDEAWTIMQNDDSARFLFGLVKRARKYWLGITTITQDTEDFIQSKYGKPIITNSSMQLLLKQAPAAIEGLAKIFNLTQGEQYMLLNSSVGQGLFFAGSKHVACEIIASYSEDRVITTKPEDVAARMQSDFS